MDEESVNLPETGDGADVRSGEKGIPRRHAAAVLQEAAYGIKVWIQRPYDEALAATKRSLAKEGFEIASEYDLRTLFRERLGIDFRRYTILGALNPQAACRGLTLDVDLGLLLPFNVVVYEEMGGTIVEAIDSIAHLAIADSADIEGLARAVKQRLQDVVDHVAAGLA